MLTRSIVLESKEFGPLQGRSLTVQVPETLKDCEALTVRGEPDVVARFAESIIRAQNNGARAAAPSVLKKAGNPEEALKTLQAKVTAYRFSVRAKGEGVSKPKTAAGAARSIAQTAGNKMFDRLQAEVTAGNAANLDRLVKQGFVDRAEFDAYVSKKAEAVKEAAAPKAPKAPKAAATK